MLVFVAVCLTATISIPTLSVLAGEPQGPVGSAQSRALDLAEVVAAGESMPRLHSLLVSQRGQRLLERYFNGHGPEDLANVKSVSKSVLSALVGIAIEQGYLDGIDTTMEEYFADVLAHDPEKTKITLENLLTMQSGLRTTSNGNYGAWISSDDWVATALRQPLDALPGVQMQYSTGNTHLLSAILTRATGRSTFDFAREALAEPLGFELAAWTRDPRGIYLGGNDMQLTPRQMLAFGELYLNKGRVGDRQIVPAAWVEASLQPHAKSPVGENRYYGYGWWVCALAGYSAPHAWGYGGQFIVLVPTLDLVIVTTSSDNADARANEHANRVYQLLQQIIRLTAEEWSPVSLTAHASDAARP